METLAVLCRFALMLVFCVSGVGKLLDLDGTRLAFRSFRIPAQAIRLASIGLMGVELAVAFGLVFRSSTKPAAVGSLLLFLVFGLVIASALRRGEAPNCNCFGQVTQKPVNRQTLLRNAVLAVPAVVLVALSSDKLGPTFLPVTTDSSANQDSGRVLTGALSFLVIAFGAALIHLLLAHRALRHSFDELRTEVELHRTRSDPRAVAPQSGLPIGVLAPDAVVQTSIGETTVRSVVADQQDGARLLVFASTSCGPCRELLRSFDRNSVRHLITVVLPVSRNDAQEYTSSYPCLSFLFAGDTGLADRYEARWTPAAVVISTQGRIASATAFGTEAINNLLDRMKDGGLGSAANLGELPDVANNVPLGTNQTALVYWRSSCPYCAAYSAELSDWLNESDDTRPDVVFLVHAEDDVTDPMNRPVVVDNTGGLANALKLSGTPSALLISSTGSILSEPCVGADAIRLLLGSTPPAPTTAQVALTPKTVVDDLAAAG